MVVFVYRTLVPVLRVRILILFARSVSLTVDTDASAIKQDSLVSSVRKVYHLHSNTSIN